MVRHHLRARLSGGLAFLLRQMLVELFLIAFQLIVSRLEFNEKDFASYVENAIDVRKAVVSGNQVVQVGEVVHMLLHEAVLAGFAVLVGDKCVRVVFGIPSARHRGAPLVETERWLPPQRPRIRRPARGRNAPTLPSTQSPDDKRCGVLSLSNPKKHTKRLAQNLIWPAVGRCGTLARLPRDMPNMAARHELQPSLMAVCLLIHFSKGD